ncbi:hypothetical protein D3C73_1470360 [compost metagenome]
MLRSPAFDLVSSFQLHAFEPFCRVRSVKHRLKLGQLRLDLVALGSHIDQLSGKAIALPEPFAVELVHVARIATTPA